MLNVKVKRLHKDAVLPQYATSGSSGFDLEALEDIAIPAGKTVLVRTGLAFEIPSRYELQIRPRSGISLKTTLRIANSPGTVDSDYRGEIGVIITNIASRCHDSFGNGCGCVGESPIWIRRGQKIAQGVLCPVLTGELVELIESETLEETARGCGGFGSTGK